MKKAILLLTAIIISVTSFSQDTTSTSKTDEALATVIQKAMSLAEKTGDFVVEQAPDVIQQFFTYHLLREWVWCGVEIIFFIFLLWLTIKAIKSEGAEDFLFVIFMIVIVDFGVFCAIISSVLDIIQISVAPKVYLIEYFTNR